MTVNYQNDDELFAALAEAVETLDPVPDSITAFGRSAWVLLDLEAELAELESDSLHGELTAVRSTTAGIRVQTYTVGDLEIELEIDVDEGIVGTCDPPCRSAVLETVPFGDQVSITEELSINQAGVFRFPAPGVPFRLTLAVKARRVRTPFIDLS